MDKGIKELVDVKRIEIEPGKTSEVIQRGAGSMVIAGVSGYGAITEFYGKRGLYRIAPDNSPRLSREHGDKFQISVPAGSKESLVVMIFTIAT